jgi:hypothetical protein
MLIFLYIIDSIKSASISHIISVLLIQSGELILIYSINTLSLVPKARRMIARGNAPEEIPSPYDSPVRAQDDSYQSHTYFSSYFTPYPSKKLRNSSTSFAIVMVPDRLHKI